MAETLRTSQVTKSDRNIIKINLDNDARPTRLIKRRTGWTPQPDRHHSSDTHDVAAFINLRGSDPSLRLFTSSPDATSKRNSSERWHHLAIEAITFEKFKEFARDITYEYHKICLPVVLRLLDEVADKHEMGSAYGSYIRPGTAIRCDGKDPARNRTPDATATFVSFPFFDIAHGKGPASRSDQSLHLVRNLFQQFYPQELTNDRDAAQQFRTFRDVKPGQFLCVPQLWVLTLDSTTIISCGPKHLKALCQNFLEIVPETEVSTQITRLVQVTDFHNRVTCLRADQCKSFLALQTRIQEECLLGKEADIDHCSIHWGDTDTELDPAQWPSLLRDSASALVNIRLRKIIRTPSTNQSSSNDLDAALLIDYTDLGSEDELQRDERMALVRVEFSKHRFAKSSISKVEVEKRHFEDQGYIYGDTNGLERDGQADSHLEFPRMFRRPTIAQVKAASSPTDDTSSVSSERSSSKASCKHVASDNGPSSGSETSLRKSGISPESRERAQHAYVESEQEDERESSASHSDTGSEEDAILGASPPGSGAASVVSSKGEESEEGLERKANEPFYVEGSPKSSYSSFESNDSDSESEQEGHLEGSEHVEQPSNRIASGIWDHLNARELRKAAQEASVRLEEEGSQSSFRDLVERELRPRMKNIGWQEHQIEKALYPRGKKQRSTKENAEKYAAEKRKRAAKLRKRAKEDEFLENAMRKRLAQFGFQENQIQAMVYPERFAQRHQPTYAKIRREYLDVETLNYYDIPYEYDMDPNYIIVLREMSQMETDILFEHTRRLRSMKRDYNDGEARPSQNETLFVGRRSKPQHKFNVLQNHRGTPTITHNLAGNPRRGQPLPGRTGGPRPRTRRTDSLRSNLSDQGSDHDAGRDNSPERPSKPLDARLRVPPFFAWPALGEQRTSQREITPLAEKSLNEDQDERTQIDCTLFVLRKRIYQEKEHAGGSRKPKNVFICKAGSEYVSIPQRAVPRTSLQELEHGTATGDNSELLVIKALFAKETTFMQSADPALSTSLAGQATSEALVEAAIPSTVASRQILQWQTAKMWIEATALRLTIIELVGQFVPTALDHHLVQQCWGSVHRVNEVLLRLTQDTHVVSQKQSDKHEEANGEQNDLIYIVVDIPDKEYLRLHNIEDLSKPLNSCEMCSRGRQHADIDTALDHLQRYHMGSEVESFSGTREHMGHWLLPTLAADQEKKNAYMLDFLEHVHRSTKKLLGKAVELRSSVADESYRKEEAYQLPVSLVLAGAKTFQFVYYLGFSAKSILDSGVAPQPPDNAPALPGLRRNASGAEYCARLADMELSISRDELMMIIHTGQTQHAVHHIRTTPESTMLVLLEYLATRPLVAGHRILDLYQDNMNRLRYQASLKPSKRLLRDLYLLKDEIEVVAYVLPQQRNAFLTLGKILPGDSFRIPHKARIEAFESLEREIIQAITIKEFLDYEEHIDRMYKEADKLAEIVRHNIGILEEGNSKAIFIFTLVTSVFLPLSFVSSVFGMNTSDIRNMANGQSLFWAVALPVTAAIGGLSLLVAFRGETLKEQINSVFKGTPQNDFRPKRKERLLDIEKQKLSS